MANRYCGNCGNELGPNGKFCTNCGSAVHRTETAQPTPPPPAILSEEQEIGSVENPVEVLLSDPLTEITRKTRLYLLIASVVGVAVAKAGLVPSEISGLGFGVAFREAVDLNPLYVILAAVIGYFVWAYFLYASSDFLIWNHRLRVIRYGMEVTSRREAELTEQAESDLLPVQRPGRFIPVASINRAAFEFLVPLLVGAYAIYALLSA